MEGPGPGHEAVVGVLGVDPGLKGPAVQFQVILEIEITLTRIRGGALLATIVSVCCSLVWSAYCKSYCGLFNISPISPVLVKITIIW